MEDGLQERKEKGIKKAGDKGRETGREEGMIKAMGLQKWKERKV